VSGWTVRPHSCATEGLTVMRDRAGAAGLTEDGHAHHEVERQQVTLTAGGRAATRAPSLRSVDWEGQSVNTVSGQTSATTRSTG